MKNKFGGKLNWTKSRPMLFYLPAIQYDPIFITCQYLFQKQGFLAALPQWKRNIQTPEIVLFRKNMKNSRLVLPHDFVKYLKDIWHLQVWRWFCLIYYYFLTMFWIIKNDKRKIYLRVTRWRTRMKTKWTSASKAVLNKLIK